MSKNNEGESTEFVVYRPENMISCGFGIGLIPFASGTFGTLSGLPIFFVLNYLFTEDFILLVILLMLAIGVLTCELTGRQLEDHDSSMIVWDEIVAFCFLLYFIPLTISWVAIGFILFRIFDILKPFPINLIDLRLRNGLGVMADDLLAALFSLGVIYLLKMILMI